MRRGPALLLGAVLVAAGGPALAAGAKLGVDFSWDKTSGCFDPVSPAFTVTNAPKGTAFLEFRMTDLQAPDFPHGGGVVPYSGPHVPRGAFSYKGPCPPKGAHDYRWTVKALDTGRTRVLGEGSKTLPYSQ